MFYQIKLIKFINKKMKQRDKLITKTNQIIKLINESKINHPAIPEFIKLIKEYDKFMLSLIEEIERDNIQLSLERNAFDEKMLNYNIRIQSLGFSLFQFLTFDIEKAYIAKNEGKLSEFMKNHKSNIKSILKR